MKLPYGNANFEKIRTEGYFYVDKTRYIELLEQRPESHVIILRSRRFGKSLFCNMLTFNFSGINTETLENANDGFAHQVRINVGVFLERYQEHFSSNERRQILSSSKPNDMLTALFTELKGKGLGQCVFVVIDEYDHFANNILSQGKAMFKELVRTDGYVCPVYEALKIGTENVVDRMFITGVLPILLDSLTSGFNVGKNLSTNEDFNEMFGFTEAEILPL